MNPKHCYQIRVAVNGITISYTYIQHFSYISSDHLLSSILLPCEFRPGGLMHVRYRLAAVWISVVLVGAVISSRGGFRRVPLPLSAVVVVRISSGSGSWEP